ncbi:nucleotide triphosphate diphosphatase NUDT15 [Aspergillus stella-maris]|uniref:nucleotide triphosphate diphosphatase NUDT15 n=1 Tax=Aspergillus stella-maris TaxID=1810926 RepID=UPI003CCD30C8
MSNQNVRVGVGVFALTPDAKFIIGQRKGSHGAGTWALPGGHLELNESFETCALREVAEETGLELDPSSIRFLTATNDIMLADNKHYVTIFVSGMILPGQGEAKILEPEKCSEWRVVEWNEIRRDWEENVLAGKEGRESKGKKLFVPLVSLFEQRRGFEVV